MTVTARAETCVTHQDSQSERIARLIQQAMLRSGSFTESLNPFTRDVALWRAARDQRSRVQVRAQLLLELVGLAQIEIGPDWTLAGEHLAPSVNGFGFAFQNEPCQASPEQLCALGVAAEDAPRVRELVRNWVRCPGNVAAALGAYGIGQTRPGSDLARANTGTPATFVYNGGGWIENHSIRDYAKVLRLGFRGIRGEVEAQLAGLDLADPETPQRESFLRAALAVCDAGILLGQRYAERARALASQASDPAERARLMQMAACCARVPAECARTLREATQSLWLAHILTCGEDSINANSIGRMDQILQPYYQADLEASRTTRAEALDLMEELACKLYLDYDVQAITLGGLDADGHDAVNEMSYLILESTRNVGFVRDVSLRLHKHSPRPFVKLAAEMLSLGGGIPFFFNDDCFVKALSDRGIALQDARNYSPIGCIELTVPGRANPHAVSGWFNGLKCLELALFDGRDPRNGLQFGPHTGMLTDLHSYEELYQAYCTQVEHLAKEMVYHCNRGELLQREWGPLPCWSTLTDDCIARGRDITDGGAVYNYHSICFMGTANLADGLAAIRKLVFQDKQVAPEALLQALRDDWQGHEALRQRLLHDAPKYGNDVPEVDDIARQVGEHFIALMDQMRSPLGGRYYVHLFTFLLNIAYGKATGATPDGRMANEPLAYSLSAHQGRDEAGVTALINSVARLPHNQSGGATAAIIEIDPVLVATPEGVDRLADAIQSAIDMGVGQMQWNVTTVERLELAQRDPEHYGNITVRVAGYSQMFKLVDRELQNHIIARTKHAR
ncbi:MAG: hypothetical protein GX557_00175 [Chloroflexi bacterium]|nr:hypothetical protein [Chloroflexota bacterium]